MYIRLLVYLCIRMSFGQFWQRPPCQRKRLHANQLQVHGPRSGQMGDVLRSGNWRNAESQIL